MQKYLIKSTTNSKTKKRKTNWKRYGIRFLVITQVVVASLTFSCHPEVDWLTYRGENGSGYTSNSIYPPLGLRWKLRLQDNLKEKEARAFNPPIVINDTIYFGSTDGNFYAMDTETGFMRWIFQTRGRVNSIPFADDKTVYFGSNDTRVYAVDIKTGKERWNFRTSHTVQSLILKHKDSVIFTSDRGATYFLDDKDVPPGSSPRVEYKIPNPVWSHHTFQVYDGIVYWAPKNRGFGAFDIETKRFLWDLDITAPHSLWFSFPAVDEERVYYSSSYSLEKGALLQFYSTDRKDGTMIWTKKMNFEPGIHMKRNKHNYFMRHVYLLDYLAPALYQNMVIYTSGDTVVRAFDADDGEEAWRKTFKYPTSSAPMIAGDRIYFGVHGSAIAGNDDESDPPRLICLSAKTGRKLWEMELEGAVLSAPVISGKRIMFGTDKLMFYVLEEIF